MSEPNAPEPTMEEILASIRRIISEDEPATGASAPVAEPPQPAHADADDVLELTEPVREEPPPIETHGDIEVHAAPAAPVAAAPPPAPPPFVAPPPVASGEPLVGNAAASMAASHFGQLTQHVSMPVAGRSLEDVVRELLNPLLKEWLDANLPAIVQAKVEEEVERIARRR